MLFDNSRGVSAPRRRYYSFRRWHFHKYHCRWWHLCKCHRRRSHRESATLDGDIWNIGSGPYSNHDTAITTGRFFPRGISQETGLQVTPGFNGETFSRPQTNHAIRAGYWFRFPPLCASARSHYSNMPFFIWVQKYWYPSYIPYRLALFFIGSVQFVLASAQFVVFNLHTISHRSARWNIHKWGLWLRKYDVWLQENFNFWILRISYFLRIDTHTPITFYPSGIHSFSFMLDSTEVPNPLYQSCSAWFLRIGFFLNLLPSHLQCSVVESAKKVPHDRTLSLLTESILRHIACRRLNLISYFPAMLSRLPPALDAYLSRLPHTLSHSMLEWRAPGRAMISRHTHTPHTLRTKIPEGFQCQGARIKMLCQLATQMCHCIFILKIQTDPTCSKPCICTICSYICTVCHWIFIVKPVVWRMSCNKYINIGVQARSQSSATIILEKANRRCTC